MGKIDKKLKKLKGKRREEEKNGVADEKLKAVSKLIEEEKYAEAINEMETLAELHCKNPLFFYSLAYCYFMTGDYERSASWAANTLSLDPAHAKTRLLLARLCLNEDRTNDALAIYDFVLENLASSLTDEDKEEIEELLEYYADNEADMLKADYPHIADFLKLDDEEDDEAEIEIIDINASDDKKDDGENGKMDDQASRAEMSNMEKGSSAVIEQLKAVAERAHKHSTVESEREKAQEIKEAHQLIDEIMQREISLIEKVRILNSFAGCFYMSLEYEKARALLEEAVRIDTHNEYTLRNMAFLLLAEGRSDEAMEWAARLPMTDFGLLYTMQCNG